MPFGLVDELEKYVVDRTADECAQVEELAVYPMQRGLEEVALTRVFTIKQIQELL